MAVRLTIDGVEYEMPECTRSQAEQNAGFERLRRAFIRRFEDDCRAEIHRRVVDLSEVRKLRGAIREFKEM